MTVVVVRNVKEKVAVSLVEKNFSQLNSSAHCPSNHIYADPPLLKIRRTQITFPRLELEQGKLLMGWIGASVDYLPRCMQVELTFCNFRQGTVFSFGSKTTQTKAVSLFMVLKSVKLSLCLCIASLKYFQSQNYSALLINICQVNDMLSQ